MKIRANYVSNSSSSSFLVYGNQCGFDDIERLLGEGKEIWCVDYGAGTSGDCADFVFKMTKERFDFLKQYRETLEYKQMDIVCEKFIVGESRFEEKIEIPSLRGGRFFNYDRDYNSPHTDDADDEDFLEWIQYRVESYE